MEQRATLRTLTNAKLVGVYNGLITWDMKPLSAWRGQKEVLIDRILPLLDSNISILGDGDRKRARTEATEKPEPKKVEPVETGNDEVRTIREAALQLMCHVDYYEDRNKKAGPDNAVRDSHPAARSVGIAYLDIIARIQDEFPDCQTSVACLRWYAVKVRVEELGYEDYCLPQRRPRAKPSRS